MIVILTARTSGVSQYILYKASLAVRRGKLLLVLVEDTLSDRLIPDRILHRRFNPRSLYREVRQHRQALQSNRADQSGLPCQLVLVYFYS